MKWIQTMVTFADLTNLRMSYWIKIALDRSFNRLISGAVWRWVRSLIHCKHRRGILSKSFKQLNLEASLTKNRHQPCLNWPLKESKLIWDKDLVFRVLKELSLIWGWIQKSTRRNLKTGLNSSLKRRKLC